MTLLYFLNTHVLFVLIAMAVLGLIIGSFLNVVISRYPKMLEAEWRRECLAFLHQTDSEPSKTFNLWKPRSHCQTCNAKISFWQNIPLISFFILGGKCAYCKADISPVYPLVEIITMAASVLIVGRYGISYTSLSALIFTYALITLSFIDYLDKILPDTITISMVWIGMFVSLFHTFTSPDDAIVGVMVGYCFLWAVAKLFKLIRNKDGMGYGDFKMLAMTGAWLGIHSVLNTLLVSVILGLVIGIVLLLARKITRANPIPFGPFIAIAGWATMMYGNFFTDLITKYLNG